MELDPVNISLPAGTMLNGQGIGLSSGVLLIQPLKQKESQEAGDSFWLPNVDEVQIGITEMKSTVRWEQTLLLDDGHEGGFALLQISGVACEGCDELCQGNVSAFEN